MNPQDADIAFLRGNVKPVALDKAEGALPYPPGVQCAVPGEVRGGSALKDFPAREEGINLLPGFSPELQGVSPPHDEDARPRADGYRLTGQQGLGRSIQVPLGRECSAPGHFLRFGHAAVVLLPGRHAPCEASFCCQ